MNVCNATELYILKHYMSSYVYFLTIKKKKQNSGTCYKLDECCKGMLSERDQTQKGKYFMIPPIFIIFSRQNHGDKVQ